MCFLYCVVIGGKCLKFSSLTSAFSLTCWSCTDHRKIRSTRSKNSEYHSKSSCSEEQRLISAPKLHGSRDEKIVRLALLQLFKRMVVFPEKKRRKAGKVSVQMVVVRLRKATTYWVLSLVPLVFLNRSVRWITPDWLTVKDWLMIVAWWGARNSLKWFVRVLQSYSLTLS